MQALAVVNAAGAACVQGKNVYDLVLSLLNWFVLSSPLATRSATESTRERNSLESIHYILHSQDILGRVTRIQATIIETDTHSSVAIKCAKAHVEETVKELSELLIKIQAKQERHKTLYFPGWRSTQCSGHLFELNLLLKKLDIRWQDLQSIVGLLKSRHASNVQHPL